MDNTIVSFKEFRLNAQTYIDGASKGKSFLVIKRSRPVFRILPVEDAWESVADFTEITPKGVKAKTLLKYL
jgi:antitoxin (DNA-binding transcriptional repressor) of toxin-antitoxin stability system